MDVYDQHVIATLFQRFNRLILAIKLEGTINYKGGSSITGIIGPGGSLKMGDQIFCERPSEYLCASESYTIS